MVHFGAKPWDGATKLSDLYDCKHKEILEFVPEYKMNLIDPAGMTDEDFEKFSTSLGKVLKFMKLSNNRLGMKNLMEADDDYSHMERNAARVLRECANISIDIDSNEEVIDMCKAWKDEAIVVTIETARRYGASDEKIVADIMEQYKLTDKEAKDYLFEKSA